jgi:5-oxoprolinase (ATP-hydrolysing)
MPVHLGSMGERQDDRHRRAGTMQPGDVFVLNAPHNGARICPMSR